MIKVTNNVTIYEVDGKETKMPRPTLSVESHWVRDELVVLEIDGKRLAVTASDLQAAITNARNTSRHG